MFPDRLRPSMVAVTLAAVVVLGGVAAGTAATGDPVQDVTDADAPDDETTETDDEVVAEFEERLSTIDTLVMTQETNMTMGPNRTTTTETKLWADFETNRLRREVVESSYGSEMVTVRNESKTVTYTPDSNQYNRYNTSQENLSVGITRMLDASEITYEGREQVDGESTYRLHLVPNTSRAGSANATVWVDTETYFPTKATAESTSERMNYTVSVDFRNVSLNTEIPESRFSIDIPENASEPEPSIPETTSYDSLSALQSAADMSVPDPDVPSAFEFDTGYLTRGDDYSSVSLQYVNESGAHVSVSKRPHAGYDYSDNDRFESVEIGNQTGWYTEYGDTAILIWECSGSSYSIYGPLSQSETVDVASSISCT